MKAISLWQPWASAMALGSKRNETRHWPTKHRGLTAIHAAQRFVRTELAHLSAHGCWVHVFRETGDIFRTGQIGAMPFGAIVAVGNLIDCRPTESMTLGELDVRRYHDAHPLYPFTERDMGNYELGRFAWVFDEVKALPEPIPFKGSQGFFNVPDEIFPEGFLTA